MARQREAWARLGVLAAAVVNSSGFAKEPIRPVDVIPRVFRYPEPPAPQKTPEEIASESRRGWRLLDDFLGSKRRKVIKLQGSE